MLCHLVCNNNNISTTLIQQQATPTATTVETGGGNWHSLLIELFLSLSDALQLIVSLSDHLLHITVHLSHTHTHTGKVSHKVLDNSNKNSNIRTTKTTTVIRREQKLLNTMTQIATRVSSWGGGGWGVQHKLPLTPLCMNPCGGGTPRPIPGFRGS